METIDISKQLSVNVYKYDHDDWAFEISENEIRGATSISDVTDVILMLIRRAITDGHEFDGGYLNPIGGVRDYMDGGRYIDVPCNISRLSAKLTDKIKKMPVESAAAPPNSLSIAKYSV